MKKEQLQLPRHIVRSQDFSPELIAELIALATLIQTRFHEPGGRDYLRTLLEGTTMVANFYEPSTRTRLSFELAALYLGMNKVSTESASHFSSAAKGETLEDSIRVLCQYHPHVIVLRHTEVGSAQRAADISENGTRIVNAGDGSGQHPTQALLDLYTIWLELGRLDDLTVILGGDLLHGRTVHSLAYLLSRYKNIKLKLVSLPSLQMKKEILDHLDEHGVPYEVITDGSIPVEGVDVGYWTRDQKERHESAGGEESRTLIIDSEVMRRAKEKMALLHPLPRIDEIDTFVDKDPRAAYFRQAGNGLFMRMALLLAMFGKTDPESTNPFTLKL